MALLASGINTGASSAQDAYAKNQISDLYKNVLGRDADQAGLDYWTKQMASGGMSYADVQNSFLGSAENRAKNDTSSIIQQTYKNVLGRDADQAGLDYWSKQGDSSGLGGVFDGIRSSDEYRAKNSSTNAIQQDYRNLLGRDADQAGLDYWSGQNLSGADRGMAFLNSAEYTGGNGAEWARDKAASTAGTWGAGYSGVYNPKTGQVQIGNQSFDPNDYAGIYGAAHADEIAASGLSAADHWNQVGQFKGYDWGLSDGMRQQIANRTPAGNYDATFNSQVDAASETIEGRLKSLLDPNNAVIRQAGDQARMAFASRGLLNSSMSEQAAMEAMVSKAIDIAGPDAQRYFQNRMNNVDWQNKFAQDQQQQSYALQNMAVQHQYNRDLATLNNSFDTGKIDQTQNYSLRQNYLSAISQANAIYQDNVARLQAAQMSTKDKQTALDAAKTLRDSNIALMNSAFAAQPGWAKEWSVEADNPDVKAVPTQQGGR